jgi:hypothetical protein
MRVLSILFVTVGVFSAMATNAHVTDVATPKETAPAV